MDYESKAASDKPDASGGRSGKGRLENVRPAPLQLNSNAHRGDLPAIIREQPDSARSTSNPPIRPLPLPTQPTPPANTQLNTPSSSAHSVTPGLRPGLPPLPPPPRGQPPLPPSRSSNRTHQWANTPPQDAPSYTSQPPPPPPQSGHLTPSSNNWANHHLPVDPRPGNPGGIKPLARAVSPVPPVPPARLRPPNQPSGRSNISGLNGTSPSKRLAGNSHPYANPQAALHPPTNLATNLSPIDESFSAHHSPPTPSPPTQGYTVGRGPFSSGSSANAQYSLDDLRRKLVKFVLPDDGHSSTIDVTACTRGIEVLERVLKKFGKGNFKNDMEASQTEEGGLLVDGWGVYMDMGGEDGPGMILSSFRLK